MRTLYLILALIPLALVPTMTRAIDEPDYEVIRKLDTVEVRQYTAYVVAEVLASGPAEKAGNEAFRILAAYIFGKNKGESKFAMTAPVAQTAVNDGFAVQFVLPKGVTLESAPAPTDPRVRLRDVPPGRVAAIRYSGFWSESNYNEHLAKLKAALTGAGLVWTGEPIYSRYNTPWTLWFLRRNEIWLPLRKT